MAKTIRKHGPYGTIQHMIFKEMSSIKFVQYVDFLCGIFKDDDPGTEEQLEKVYQRHRFYKGYLKVFFIDRDEYLRSCIEHYRPYSMPYFMESLHHVKRIWLMNKNKKTTEDRIYILAKIMEIKCT